MAVSPTVIAAYKRRYTKTQLETALDQALEDRASGVAITQVNFQDGGGSGQVLRGDPNELIEILEITLKDIEGGGSAPPGLTSSINFSLRRSET